MKISIFGLGYVGAISAACLSKDGHTIIGVDRDTFKVDLINNGKSPIVERDLDALIASGVACGRLIATTEPKKAIQETDMSFICVGTPSQANGSIDLSYVARVSRQLGSYIRIKNDYHIVVLRSTVLPGTIHNTVIPLLEKHSGKKAGRDFGVVVNPEFMREATAVYDFFHPAKTVIGALKAEDGEAVAELYAGIEAPLIHTSIGIAEIVKYADNVFHALKITFANEIGIICKSLGVDSHEVMNIFCQDTKLNISSSYLRPGFAFGGSCLPKDVRAVTHFARHNDLELPVLNAILPSNQAHIQHALDLIRRKGKKKIGILGIAFKAGTDDLRESPVVTLVETLLGKGYEIKIYDKDVSIALLRGSNKKYIEERVPHIAALMQETIMDILSFAETLVIGNGNEEFQNIFTHLKEHQYVIDLVRITKRCESLSRYEGICW